MNRTGDSQKPVSAQRRKDKPAHAVPPSSRSFYLIIYNLVSALLWSVVLGRTLHIAGIYGYDQLYTGIGAFTKWTQTLAGLEVLHALIGASHSNRRLQREKLIKSRFGPGAASHHHHASRLPIPPRLGHRQQLPRYRLPLSCLYYDAHCLEHDRDHSLLIFRAQSHIWPSPWFADVVAV